MSVLTPLTNFFFNNIQTIIISLIISKLVYKLAKFYIKVYSLPPGPIPLPLIGNILLFRSKSHWNDVLKQVNKKYGPVFTFWMGNNPFVFIADADIAREAFGENDFAGRPHSYAGSILSNEKHLDIVFNDYGPAWKSLRRVVHSAVQKYSINDKLSYLTSDSVDYIIKIIIEKEGLNKEFNPANYIYFLFLNILATSAFGKRYDIDDPEFKKIIYVMRDFEVEVGPRLMLWEFSPLIRFLDRKMVKKYRDIINNMIDIIEKKYKTHLKDYDEFMERDFCDALISAKNDALRDGKESAPYLTDVNLAMSIFDLFGAGTDSSQCTFQWILLFIAYYPEVQQKLKQEIESQIGDRISTHEDKSRCHYVMAFISEILRLRNIVPVGFPHKAVVTSKIENYTIPEGNGVFVFQGMILTDDKYWTNPNELRPERFLENGKYMTTRSKAFIPFGVGRRVCLGEKLAITDLFLVLVRFLQSTSDHEIKLGSNGGIEADPHIIHLYAPKIYNIIFKTK